MITGNKGGFSHEGVLHCDQRIEEMLMGYRSYLYIAPESNIIEFINAL